MAKKPKTLPAGTAIEERAMLVYLSIGFWEGRKKDPTKSTEVLADEHAAKDAGAWWTRIVPPSSTKPVVNARIRARVLHLRYTLPWQDGGFRVLPAAMFLEYTSAMRAAHDEFQEAVDAFLGEYPALVAAAETRLQGLFKAEMFPEVEKLRDKYPWSLNFSPLPTAGDFRVDLGRETTEAIRQNIQDQADASLAGAMRDLWERLHSGVTSIAEKLADAKGIFRDSLIENVAELCDLLPKMNVTGDRDLETMRQAVVAKLAGQDPDVLRTNPNARADTARQAAEILKKMGTFLGKKA